MAAVPGRRSASEPAVIGGLITPSPAALNAPTSAAAAFTRDRVR